MSDGLVAIDDDDAPLAAGVMVGEYRIEKQLGEGGMGEVYLAVQPVIDKQVAIKVMNRACSANPHNVERFIQEAKAVNAIGHANIVDIFSFGTTADRRSYFVMELLRGESLRTRLQRQFVGTSLAYTVLDAVLRALEAAHARGVVHRDLKPDNIFLVDARDGEPERVKLLDFGIAKLSTSSTPDARGSKTQTGSVVGTPAYMSPEQAAGSKVEGPSDIYSLGIVAYELATGRVPFDGEVAVTVMAAHIADEPPKPSKLAPVAPKFEQLILSMIQKTPSERPTAGQIRAELAILRAAPQPASQVATPDQATVQRPAAPSPHSGSKQANVETKALRTPRDLDSSDGVMTRALSLDLDPTTTGPLALAKTVVTPTPPQAVDTPLPRPAAITPPPAREVIPLASLPDLPPGASLTGDSIPKSVPVESTDLVVSPKLQVKFADRNRELAASSATGVVLADKSRTPVVAIGIAALALVAIVIGVMATRGPKHAAPPPAPAPVATEPQVTPPPPATDPTVGSDTAGSATAAAVTPDAAQPDAATAAVTESGSGSAATKPGKPGKPGKKPTGPIGATGATGPVDTTVTTVTHTVDSVLSPLDHPAAGSGSATTRPVHDPDAVTDPFAPVPPKTP